MIIDEHLKMTAAERFADLQVFASTISCKTASRYLAAPASPFTR